MSNGTMQVPVVTTWPDNNRPAKGPGTLMWAWPLALVAAIFQPTTARPETSGIALFGIQGGGKLGASR